MLLGYNTNGLAHHRIGDALELVAELGYRALAITPDVGQLDPQRCTQDEIATLRGRGEALGVAFCVESGARFLLDAKLKHFPTLLEHDRKDRQKRARFLEDCVDLAVGLGAGTVSFWSGSCPRGCSSEDAWGRLVDGTRGLLEYADGRGVTLAFEPEPGMFVETPAGFVELRERLGAAGKDLRLCLDVGHLLVTGDLPVESIIREFAGHLGMVHLDDIRGGRHEHLPFGQGDLDLPATLSALREVGYAGIAAVELSRDSHRGAQAASQAMDALRAAQG